MIVTEILQLQLLCNFHPKLCNFCNCWESKTPKLQKCKFAQAYVVCTYNLFTSRKGCHHHLGSCCAKLEKSICADWDDPVRLQWYLWRACIRVSVVMFILLIPSQPLNSSEHVPFDRSKYIERRCNIDDKSDKQNCWCSNVPHDAHALRTTGCIFDCGRLPPPSPPSLIFTDHSSY